MFELAILALIALIAFLAHRGARRFVRERLRYVDAVHRGHMPWVVGALTVILTLPVTWMLPFIGFGTSLIVGASVGFGVARGARDVREGTGLPVRSA